jgi:predicted ATPase
MGVIRSDRLSSSPITASVLEHVFRSGLMVADLSFHNPSVLYEVGLRHASGRPCVLISREEDPIPANLRDVRLVKVNTSALWEFWSGIESRRTEIVDYSHWALSSNSKDSNPVQRLLPNYHRYIR